jgi:hypothetical protein
VDQIGRFNSISAAVFGNKDFVGGFQVGGKNSFRAYVRGDDNVVEAEQFGRGSNFAKIVEIGDWSSGSFNEAIIEQFGRFNVAKIFQLNAQLQIAFVGQLGQVDIAIVTQVDAPPQQAAARQAAALSAVAAVFSQAGWALCGDRHEHSERWCINR